MTVEMIIFVLDMPTAPYAAQSTKRIILKRVHISN